MGRWAAGLVLTGVLAAGAGPVRGQSSSGGSHTGLSWETPPVDYLPAQKRGWRAGIAAARLDYRNHHKMDLNSHDDYKHPGYTVPIDDFRDYRYGYKKGYELALKHVLGPGV